MVASSLPTILSERVTPLFEQTFFIIDLDKKLSSFIREQIDVEKFEGYYGICLFFFFVKVDVEHNRSWKIQHSCKFFVCL